jgi:hypothetical protein
VRAAAAGDETEQQGRVPGSGGDAGWAVSTPETS